MKIRLLGLTSVSPFRQPLVQRCWWGPLFPLLSLFRLLFSLTKETSVGWEWSGSRPKQETHILILSNRMIKTLLQQRSLTINTSVGFEWSNTDMPVSFPDLDTTSWRISLVNFCNTLINSSQIFFTYLFVFVLARNDCFTELDIGTICVRYPHHHGYVPTVIPVTPINNFFYKSEFFIFSAN